MGSGPSKQTTDDSKKQANIIERFFTPNAHLARRYSTAGEDHESSLSQKGSDKHKNGPAWNTTLWYESETSFINMKSHMKHKNYFKEFESYSDMGRSNGRGLTDIFQNDEENTKCKKNRHVTFQLPKRRHTYGGKKMQKSGQYLSARHAPNKVSEREIKDINSNAIYCAKMEPKSINAYQSYTISEIPLENACNMNQLVSELKHHTIPMDEVLNNELSVILKDKDDEIKIEIEELCKDIITEDNPYSHDQIDIEIQELCKDLTAEDNPYRMRKAYYYL